MSVTAYQFLFDLTVVVALLTLMRNVAYWWRMWRQAARLHRERSDVHTIASGLEGAIMIHYVIPAFQETEALPATFAALRNSIEASRYEATITVVTSVHDEPRFPGERRTRVVAEELCTGIPYARVLIDHAAAPSMAASFNTGIHTIASEEAGREKMTFVAVYNADSTATLDSVQALGDTLLARGLPPLAQLNFSSLRNVSTMTGIGGWYSLGAAYYQTRWALGFEIDMHRRNSATRRRGPLGHSYHLKGHGTVMRLDIANDMQGFSTETPCEDLELGFRLSLRDTPVHVVPILEDTESPVKASAVIAQKRYWFSGMVDVVNFHRLRPEDKRAQPWRFELQRAVSIYRSAGCFLLAPIPYWFLSISAFLLGQPIFALLPVINAIMSAWLIRRVLHQTSPTRPRLPRSTILTLPAAILVWSMTRNVGPLMYLWSAARNTDRSARMRAVHRQHIEKSAESETTAY